MFSRPRNLQIRNLQCPGMVLQSPPYLGLSQTLVIYSDLIEIEEIGESATTMVQLTILIAKE